MQLEIAELPSSANVGAGRLVDEFATLRHPVVVGRVVGFPAVQVLAIEQRLGLRPGRRSLALQGRRGHTGDLSLHAIGAFLCAGEFAVGGMELPAHLNLAIEPFRRREREVRPVQFDIRSRVHAGHATDDAYLPLAAGLGEFHPGWVCVFGRGDGQVPTAGEGLRGFQRQARREERHSRDRYQKDLLHFSTSVSDMTLLEA